MKSLIYAAALVLSGCGGGGAPVESIPIAASAQIRVLVQASDSVVSTAGYGLSLYPTHELDPFASVYQQGKQATRI